MTSIVRSLDYINVGRDHRGLRTILPSATTGGVVAVVDVEIAAGTAGPPLHIHPTSDETFLMLDGVLLVRLDGEVAQLGAGDVVHITRGTSHSFATPQSSGAHFLTLHTPGGFEEFHAEAADAERRRGAPLLPPELVRIAAGYDWQLAGPPMLPSGELLSA
jgi:quercetin dioxygenase-like cupin family protein